MLLKTTERVNESLQLTKTQMLARTCCPGCFGPTHPNDPYCPRSSVKDSLIVCLDGNFQHRHNAKAGIAGMPLNVPPLFLQPENVERMEQEISNLGTSDTQVRRTLGMLMISSFMLLICKKIATGRPLF